MNSQQTNNPRKLMSYGLLVCDYTDCPVSRRVVEAEGDDEEDSDLEVVPSYVRDLPIDFVLILFQTSSHQVSCQEVDCGWVSC